MIIADSIITASAFDDSINNIIYAQIDTYHWICHQKAYKAYISKHICLINHVAK